MKVCVLCGEKFDGYGHNAEPLAKGECCNNCNALVVAQRLSYPFSVEGRISRYEFDVLDMLNGVHDDYNKGCIEGRAYLKALRTIYTTIEELYLEES